MGAARGGPSALPVPTCWAAIPVLNCYPDKAGRASLDEGTRGNKGVTPEAGAASLCDSFGVGVLPFLACF